MPCYHPLTMGFDSNGERTFKEKKHHPEFIPIKIGCGKCIGCRIDRSREWAVRCVHELQMHQKSCFITLTYQDSELVYTEEGEPTLFHEHWQLFMKKLRKKYGSQISFFMCGEYGDQTHRPHYHALLFGVDFEDKLLLRQNENGDPIYISKTLDELWGHNDADLKPNEIGAANFQTAAYIARYVVKKLGGPMEALYNGRTPDYGKASRQYAIGKKWLEKYWEDIFNYNDCRLPDGTRTPIPRYYTKWLEKNHFDRYMLYRARDTSHMDTPEFKHEQSPQRLRVKEKIKKSSIKRLRRDYQG